MKPSIGISGKFCVCAQPSEAKTYEVDTESLSKYQQNLLAAKKLKKTINIKQ